MAPGSWSLQFVELVKAGSAICLSLSVYVKERVNPAHTTSSSHHPLRPKTMSLSFVSKAVLTAKDGGGYEETAVEGKESEGSSSMTTSQPLFEQLRTNKEQEEMEREEFQKSIMRGTLALDEEDCSYLDSLQKQRQEQEQLIKKETQSELEAVNRMEQGMMKPDQDEMDLEEKRKREDKEIERKKQQQQQSEKKPAANKPKFVVKKRKKVEANNDNNKEEADTKKAKKEESKPAGAAEDNKDDKPALSGLLAGYGSDSDSD